MKNKKKKRRVNTSRLMIVLSFLLMIIIGFYTFLNSSVFNIKNIEIQGNDKLSEDIIKNALEIKDDKNIFMYSTKKMEEKLQENTYIEDVNIKKILPDGIRVDINEKEIMGLIRHEGIYCYIDKYGNVINSIEEIDKDEKYVIVDVEYYLDKNNTIDFKNEEIKKGLLYLLECINDNNLQKKIKQINYQENDIINMYTKDGIEIILNNNKELKYNISRTSAILVDLQSKNTKGGIVDLTLGDYAVYRP